MFTLMSDEEPILTVIRRLRRAQPINNDVGRVCGELERLLFQAHAPVPEQAAPTAKATPKPKQDRKAWMREYMKDHRKGLRRRSEKPV